MCIGYMWNRTWVYTWANHSIGVWPVIVLVNSGRQLPYLYPNYPICILLVNITKQTHDVWTDPAMKDVKERQGENLSWRERCRQRECNAGKKGCIPGCLWQGISKCRNLMAEKNTSAVRQWMAKENNREAKHTHVRTQWTKTKAHKWKKTSVQQNYNKEHQPTSISSNAFWELPS